MHLIFGIIIDVGYWFPSYVPLCIPESLSYFKIDDSNTEFLSNLLRDNLKELHR